MKTLLIIATAAFISAGIYGTLDLTRDLKNGTYIRYEDEDAGSVNRLTGNQNQISRKNSVTLAEKQRLNEARKNKISVKNISVADFSLSDIKISDFSRGEPPMFYETMLLEKVGSPDSVKSTEVTSAISDTIAALNEKAKEPAKKDTVIAAKEERKFNLKLFSRGRPRPVIKETVALQNDSTKN